MAWGVHNNPFPSSVIKTTSEGMGKKNQEGEKNIRFCGGVINKTKTFEQGLAKHETTADKTLGGKKVWIGRSSKMEWCHKDDGQGRKGIKT